jgi:hypothetical protein
MIFIHCVNKNKSHPAPRQPFTFPRYRRESVHRKSLEARHLYEGRRYESEAVSSDSFAHEGLAL